MDDPQVPCPECGKRSAAPAAACPRCGRLLDADELVPVFETADGMLLAIVKSALDAAEVPYVVQGEGGAGLFPLGTLATGWTRNLLAATIHVPRGRAEEARAILEGVEEA